MTIAVSHHSKALSFVVVPLALRIRHPTVELPVPVALDDLGGWRRGNIRCFHRSATIRPWGFRVSGHTLDAHIIHGPLK